MGEIDFVIEYDNKELTIKVISGKIIQFSVQCLTSYRTYYCIKLMQFNGFSLAFVTHR